MTMNAVDKTKLMERAQHEAWIDGWNTLVGLRETFLDERPQERLTGFPGVVEALVGVATAVDLALDQIKRDAPEDTQEAIARMQRDEEEDEPRRRYGRIHLRRRR